MEGGGGGGREGGGGAPEVKREKEGQKGSVRLSGKKGGKGEKKEVERG